METDREVTVADEVRPRGEEIPCLVRWAGLDELRTSFAALRRGRVAPARRDEAHLAELPLRVVRVGLLPGYEVVDGFQRLERWRDAGLARVPVVVEATTDAHGAKRLLLAANAPRRTVSVMDEARVVAALREEGLGPKTIAKLLGRKPTWVLRRLALASGLAPSVERRVDERRVGPSLAHALLGLRPADQEAVVSAAERHGLRAREALVLVSAVRATSDVRARELLLAAPRALFDRSTPATSGVAARLEERLRRAQQALSDLAELELGSGLDEAERRRLVALQRAVFDQLNTLAQRTAGDAAPGKTPPRREDDDLNDESRRPPSAGRPDAAALPGVAGGGGGDAGAGRARARAHTDGDPAAGIDGAARPDEHRAARERGARDRGGPDRESRRDRGGAGEDPRAAGHDAGHAGDRQGGGPGSQDRAACAPRGGAARGECDRRAGGAEAGDPGGRRRARRAG